MPLLLNFKNFRTRLLFYFLATYLVVFILIIAFQYNREKDFKIKQIEMELYQYSMLINSYIDKNDIITLQNKQGIDSIKKYLPDQNLRITIILENGNVFYDSQASNNQHFDNHLQRVEIQKSIKQHFGSDIRYSNTLKRDYFYYAKRFNGYFVRVALPYDYILQKALQTDKSPFIYLLIIFILFGFISILISNYFGKLISSLKKFIYSVENDDKKVYETFSIKDFGDIGDEFVNVYKKIKSTENELQFEKAKFMQHLQISEEGVAFYSADFKEIMSNGTFIQNVNFIGDKKSSNPEIFFEIDDFISIVDFVKEMQIKLSVRNSSHEHEHKKVIITKNSKIFEINTVVYVDKSFEISIRNITEFENDKIIKQQMTGNISHELRTPVASIQGFLETIINTPQLSEEQKNYFLERSYSQVSRLSNIIQDLAILNKVEEASNFISVEKLNISNIIKEVYLDFENDLKQKAIELKYDFNQNLEFAGSHMLIYSIFRNLVDNTIKYAGEHNHIEIEKYHEDNDYYFFSYFNTGEIIPKEDLNRVFERFYRVDKGRSRKAGGTGLGLSIVKNAINFHGGEISVKNRNKDGVEFLFTLKKRKL